MSNFRLPRTRGDRPNPGDLRAGEHWAAPHTRGSTQTRTEKNYDCVGCPAHAGIDPHHRKYRASSHRLPRTRGDRPSEQKPLYCSQAAAPHTRGSTQERGTIQGIVFGCPAHAGIDPCSKAKRAGKWRLPRTRGDRPSSSFSACPKVSAAPHTRGSTHDRLRHIRRAGGCPAHAGIDPVIPACSSRTAGCPAHAGIDPSLAHYRQYRERLPRTRGDRPTLAIAKKQGGTAAPHTRGSTPRVFP